MLGRVSLLPQASSARNEKYPALIAPLLLSFYNTKILPHAFNVADFSALTSRVIPLPPFIGRMSRLIPGRAVQCPFSDSRDVTG